MLNFQVSKRRPECLVMYVVSRIAAPTAGCKTRPCSRIVFILFYFFGGKKVFAENKSCARWPEVKFLFVLCMKTKAECIKLKIFTSGRISFQPDVPCRICSFHGEGVGVGVGAGVDSTDMSWRWQENLLQPLASANKNTFEKHPGHL